MQSRLRRKTAGPEKREEKKQRRGAERIGSQKKIVRETAEGSQDSFRGREILQSRALASACSVLPTIAS